MGKVVSLLNGPSTERSHLFGGEPIWVTFAKQRSEIDAACSMYVGCDLEFEGLKLERFQPYDKTIPWTDRISLITRWFAEADVQLGLFYMDEPDATGHKSGPNSAEINQTLLSLNDKLGELIFKVVK